VDAADAIRHGDDRAGVARLGGAFEVLDALLQQLADF
jgi:hypothetical protein